MNSLICGFAATQIRFSAALVVRVCALTTIELVSAPDPPCTHKKKKKSERKVPEEGLVQLIQKASMRCSSHGLLWVR